MKKIKTIIISIFLFLIIYVGSGFLLEKIPSIYYSCFTSFPDIPPSVICQKSLWGFTIPFILGLGVAVWYFYRSSSSIKSNQKVKN
jgi:hypothetical protein